MSSVSQAWQLALAAEQQAAFGYALLGPQLSGTDKDLARACERAHDSLRDDTATAITESGLTPGVPAADYPALYPVAGARSARALAVRLEQQCAAAWRFLYAQAAEVTSPSATARRREAQAALTASAVRATQWRRAADSAPATEAFPGI